MAPSIEVIEFCYLDDVDRLWSKTTKLEIRELGLQELCGGYMILAYCESVTF